MWISFFYSAAKWSWIAFVMGSMIPNRHRRTTAHRVWRVVRPLMVLQALPIVVGTVIAAGLLMQVPGLGWSWLSLFATGAPTSGQNVSFAPLSVPWLAPFFVIGFLWLLPLFALIEERVFRAGTGSWTEGVVRSVIFGLVHCLVGVPLGVGIALTLPGLWFTRQYFRKGVLWSAAHHTSYNLWAFGFLLLAVVVSSTH